MRYLRRHPFWVILILTTVAWIGFAMSEEDDYPMELRISWVGVDTSRYVVTHADTTLSLSVKSNCFNAIKRYRVARDSEYVISIEGDTTIRVGQVLFDNISSHFGFEGISAVFSHQEVLRYATSERIGKPFVPQLRNVEFRFSDQVGLAGSPVILPDTVWLYGSQSSLDKITQLETAPAILEQISDSGYYALPLNPIWKEYDDLRVSHDIVRIYLPLERFTEIKLMVPVSFRSTNQHHKVRLYPEQVELSLWVPANSHDKISANQIEAVVDYRDDQDSQQLPVMITRFPSNTRIRQISPASIQYVIIQ